MYSSSLFSQITTPTRLSPRSKTLIENILNTDNTEDTISGNILTTISDHLAQFIMYSIEQLKCDNEMDIYKWSFNNFTPKDFQRDLENINWDGVLNIDENKANQSFDRFFNVFETLSDTHAPLKKLTNTEVKLHMKPWLTNGIKTSVRHRDKLYKIFQELRIAS